MNAAFSDGDGVYLNKYGTLYYFVKNVSSKMCTSVDYNLTRSQVVG